MYFEIDCLHRLKRKLLFIHQNTKESVVEHQNHGVFELQITCGFVNMWKLYFMKQIVFIFSVFEQWNTATAT